MFEHQVQLELRSVSERKLEQYVDNLQATKGNIINFITIVVYTVNVAIIISNCCRIVY